MASEYICKDCGSLLTHSNELTLQSMKEIHAQSFVLLKDRN